MKKIMNFLAFITMFSLLFPACQDDETLPVELTCEEKVDTLPINQLQFLGSHNSYRTRTFDPIMQFLYSIQDSLPPGFNPDEWDYGHVPLEEQFDSYGIRSIELDVFNDPDGGMFFPRRGNAVLGLDPLSNEPALLEPGLKVLHYPDLDYNTHYFTFKQALTAVKTWSDANKSHLPIIILVEPKEDNPSQFHPEFVQTIPFDKNSLGTIDEEIKDVFGEDLLFGHYSG